MINLKQETIEAIEENKKDIKDVMFVGTNDGKLRIPIELFLDMSDFVYHNGFGGNEISTNLIVFFKDGSYLRREEYDGSEWWTYISNKSFNEIDEFEELTVDDFYFG